MSSLSSPPPSASDSRSRRYLFTSLQPPADSKRLPNEDTSTPVSTPTGNGPSKFGVSVHVEPQPPPLPPRIPSPSVLRSVGSVDRATSIPPKVSNGFQPKTKNEEIRNRSQPTSPHTKSPISGPTDSFGVGSVNGSLSSGFETVRPTKLPSGAADEPVQNSPPSVKHDTLLLPPPAAPSTQSSGNSDEQNCDPPSLNEDSLLLPPPAPWNTDDCSTSSFVTNSSSKTSGCKSDRNSSQGSFESGYHKTSNPISDNYPVRFPMHNRINSPKSHSVLDEVSVADDFTRTDELELGSEELSSMTDESTYASARLIRNILLGCD
ncbi:unnamed protein product [Calicophoron daubneyi]|uniref:Uncharacterized protein n=1 Tax=Calicophoron daubneyi TaxID=300641 RepID=A0AAV2T3U4_CALDB